MDGLKALEGGTLILALLYYCPHLRFKAIPETHSLLCMNAKQVHVSGLGPGLAGNLVSTRWLAQTKIQFGQFKAMCNPLLSMRGKS